MQLPLPQRIGRNPACGRGRNHLPMRVDSEPRSRQLAAGIGHRHRERTHLQRALRNQHEDLHAVPDHDSVTPPRCLVPVTSWQRRRRGALPGCSGSGRFPLVVLRVAAAVDLHADASLSREACLRLGPLHDFHPVDPGRHRGLVAAGDSGAEFIPLCRAATASSSLRQPRACRSACVRDAARSRRAWRRS